MVPDEFFPPDDSNDPTPAQRWASSFQSSLLVMERMLTQAGTRRAAAGEFSYKAARAMAQKLILAKTTAEARQHIVTDRKGSVSFYEVAHEVSDRLRAGEIAIGASTDGKHEPLLLVAAAVLNFLGDRGR